MGFNTSERKRHSMLLAAELRQWQGGYVHIECAGGCQPPRAYAIEKLDAAYPALTVGSLVRRLRCVRCGRPPVDVRLVVPDTQGRPDRIEVVLPF